MAEREARVEFVVRGKVVLVRMFKRKADADHYKRFIENGRTQLKGMEVKVSV